jgi:hypothetical protein
MSNESWKRYGGVSKTDKFKNLTIGTLVADQVLLRQKVSTVTEFPNSINVTNGDLSVLKGSLSGQNLTVNNSLTSKDATIQNKITIGNSGSTNSLSLSNTTGGINIDTQILDICANFILRSSSTTAQNVIAQNSNTNGIIVSVDANNNSYIDFFKTNKTPQPPQNSAIAGSDAKISALTNTLQFESSNIKINSGSTIDISSNNTGNIRTAGALKLLSNANIDVSANTLLNLIAPNTTIYSRLHVTNRDVSSNLLNETMVIYDISAGRYLYDVYNNNSYTKGSALTLVSNDTVSNTFMNIITPNKLGLGIGGGSYIKDTARSFGTIGVYNSQNQYIPSQNIVSGNSKEKYYSTIGVNKHAPSTENYVMDINGATRITNGEINKVQDMSFQILNVAFSKTNKLFGIAVGTPSSITSPYTQNIYYTNDGGANWRQSVVDNNPSGLASGYRNLCIYVYDSSYAVIGANDTFLLYTNNGGQNWTTYTTSTYIGFDSIYSIYSTIYDSKKYVVIAYTTNYVNYYGIFLDKGSTINNSNIISNTNQTIFIDGYSNYIYCVGNGIQKYQINTSSPSTSNLSSVYNTVNSNYRYNHINVLDNLYAVAVGSNIISYTKDGGNNWNNVLLTNTSLNMCYVYDTLRAVAVGENGQLLYTNDGYLTWNIIPDVLLNSGGNSNILNGSGNSLKTIYMPNINSLVISKIIQTYNSASQLGLSNIYYCYLPNLFNRSQNSVFDISGSSQIGGDLTITEGGKLIVNYDSSLNGNLFVNYDVSMKSRLYVGNDATINTRLFTIGDTSLNSRLYIASDVTMNKRLFTLGDASFNSNLFVNYDTSLNSRLVVGSDVTMNKRLFTLGDASFNSNLFVNYDTSLNSRLVVGSDVTMNKRLFTLGDVSFNSNLFVNYDTSLNSRLVVGSDVTMNKRLFTLGDSSFNGNLFVNYDTTMNSRLVVGSDVTMNKRLFTMGDASFNSNLFVNYDTSMNSRLVVGSDARINKRLFVIGDSSFSGSLYIASDATIIGNLNVTSRIINNADVIMKSGLFVDLDVSINGGVTIGKDVVINGNLTVKQAQSQNVINTTVNNYNLIISEDLSLNGRLIASGDISFNSNLYISKNMNVNTSNNITNALVNINGNMITNYVGINTTSVNTNRALDINGNIVQSNGCIFQF